MAHPALARLTPFAACLAATLLLAGCEIGTAYRDPVSRTDADMRAVIDAYIASGAQPVHTLNVAEARTQPTLEAAYRSVAPFRAEAAMTVPTPVIVDGAAGPLAARLYDPAPGRRNEPVILYFHGGLGVTGGGGADDAAARALALGAKAKVLSVDYRLAPENPFPAAYDDAVAAYRWLQRNAATLGADPRRIAVAGEDAGGTLALNVAVAARDSGLRPPVHLLLIDPMADMVEQTDSAVLNRYAVPLDRADVAWSRNRLTRSEADRSDPRLDLVGSADLHRLPPVSIVISEMNPLGSEALILADKLQASGVAVRPQLYAGTTFGFFGMGATVERARQAQAFAAAELAGPFAQIASQEHAPRHATPAHRAHHRRPAPR